MVKLFRNKKAQNTAEYAILIGLIIGALVTMQTYVKRSFQAKVKNAADYRAEEVRAPKSGEDALFVDTQYEPYYVQSEATTVATSASSLANQGKGNFQADSKDDSSRTGKTDNTDPAVDLSPNTKYKNTGKYTP